VVTIVLEPSSPDYKRWRDLMLHTLRRYALDDHILSDVADPSIYWAKLDNTVVTWIFGTLSPELHEIIQELLETAHQAWLMIEAQFLSNSESGFCNSTLGYVPSSKATLASTTTVTG
jgi:hypothetical protein